MPSAFHDPGSFAFVSALEAACLAIREECRALDGERDFVESPDSLTAVADGYDERGWRWYGLVGGDADPARLARCPATALALAVVPDLRNAGFSRFRPGTHLYPHQGELEGVLRCHLALDVPDGDCAIRFGDEVRSWTQGRCLVFDDTIEHEAWNRTDGDRTVLLVTFGRARA